MAKRSMRCLAYPFMTACILFFEALGIALDVVLLAFEPARLATFEIIPLGIFYIIFFYGLTIAVAVLMVKPLLSKITIDETGITRAFLGRFFKLRISWEEMAEARYYVRVSEQMVFSKTRPLSTIPMNKWYKVKDTIPMGFSKKRYAVIEQYLQKPMVGMPDKVKARLNRGSKREEV